MWLQMGEDDGAPLVYFHQVKHMWVGYADGRSGAVGEDAEAGETQAKAQVLTAQNVEPKQAVLRMQMQRDAQVPACVDSTSRTVEVWGPTRQHLPLVLYVGERRNRGMAGEWDPDTEMHPVRKVMAMVDYDGAALGRAKGHTIQVVSPQATATGAADQGVTDLVQDGHTWWVVEPRGDRRKAVVYTAALLKRVEHPLMRWVGELEEVRVKRAEKIPERAVLGPLEWQMDRCAEAEELEDIREQIRLAMERVASSKGREQLRWMVPPGMEKEHRTEPLARARRLVEREKKQCLEVEEDPEGARPSKWRGLRRGRGGQMSFIVGDGDVGEQEGGKENQPRKEEGRGPGQEANGRVEQEEDGEGVEEGAAEEGEQENAAGDRVDERDRGGGTGEGSEREDRKRRREEDEQEPQERPQQEVDEDGRPKRKRVRESGTERNKWAGRRRERCEKG